MNRNKIINLACAFALSAAPFTAGAYTAEEAINNCAAALTAEMSVDGLAYRIDEDSDTGGRLDRLQVIYMDARDSATDEVVARADCVVDSRARVLRLHTLPIDADDAQERSLTAY